jgi:Tat protein secretion system quality control protein TatD with DNase activity
MRIIDAELREIIKDAISNCITEIGLDNDPEYWEEKKKRYEQLKRELSIATKVRKTYTLTPESKPVDERGEEIKKWKGIQGG